MRFLRRTLAVLLMLVTCLAVPTSPTGDLVTLRVAGLTRHYLVVRPATTGGTRLPVLIMLHGCCTTPAVELARDGFTAPAILVYPAGYRQYWNAGACCGNTGADDVAFLTEVARRARALPGADPTRVYLAGYSNGGRMAYRLACERPGLFAAVAVFGAVSAKSCRSPTPTPLLIAAGTADPELTPRTVDGYREPTVAAEVSFYLRANGCTGPPSLLVAGRVLTRRWTACASGAPVQLSLYSGGDHAWQPGLAALIWTFLRHHRSTG